MSDAPKPDADGKIDVIEYLSSDETHRQQRELTAAKDALRAALAEAEADDHRHRVAEELLEKLHVVRGFLPLVPFPAAARPFVGPLEQAIGAFLRALAGG